MSQSVSAKRRLRSARREAHAWASRSASISACVRQRISATDDHLQVVGPEAPPCVQGSLVVLRCLVVLRLRAWTDGPQERHMQFTVHPPSRKHRAGVEDALDARRLAIGEAREVEYVAYSVHRGGDAVAVEGVGDGVVDTLRRVGNAHHFHLPTAIK